VRRRHPELHRPFRTPWVPFVPVMGMAVSFIMMASLHALTWKVFLSWLCVGLVVYFLYGHRHSKVQQAARFGQDADVATVGK
jgi:basic amino acid/polyamine antiporter, APA family